MKSLATRLAVALATFAVGVSLTALVFRHAAPRVAVTRTVDSPLKYEYIEIPPCDFGAVPGSERDETPEQKAVRLAEEFVARNGYTDLPPDRDNLSYESIEWEGNIDEMLRFRRDSLERKAYGIRYNGRMGRSGWTVVFKHKRGDGTGSGKVGRAVTMDGDFGNLRVEHKDFFLAGVEKKL
jgi:hypothetical protein